MPPVPLFLDVLSSEVLLEVSLEVEQVWLAVPVVPGPMEEPVSAAPALSSRLLLVDLPAGSVLTAIAPRTSLLLLLELITLL